MLAEMQKHPNIDVYNNNIPKQAFFLRVYDKCREVETTALTDDTIPKPRKRKKSVKQLCS